MIQFLIYALIVSVMLFDGMADLGWAPRIVAYFPELIGGLLLVYVIGEGRKTRFRYVRGMYWVVFLAIGLICLCSIVVNNVEPGAVITGVRYMLRALPLFVLPAVYTFTDKQLKSQMVLILALCLLQLPIAIWQSTLPDVTGDGVVGTLVNTSFMSPFLVFVGCMLMAQMMRGRLRILPFLLLLVLVLGPTGINETKVTVILLPLGVVTVMFFGSAPGKRLRNLGVAAMLSALLLTGFVAAYNFQQRNVEGALNLVDFFVGGGAEQYMDTGAGFGSEGEFGPGRTDALMVPLVYVAKDPIKLALGVGLGNASPSPLGPRYQGKYAELFRLYLQFTAVRVILEIGFLGFGLTMLLLFMSFLDAREVARRDEGLHGAIALGWTGVAVVMLPTLFYADTIVSSAIAYLFWYFAGLVAAQRMRLSSGPHERPYAPPATPTVA